MPPRLSLEKNAAENEFFAKVWQSQKDFAEVAVPFWAGAQASNANLGKAFADSTEEVSDPLNAGGHSRFDGRHLVYARSSRDLQKS